MNLQTPKVNDRVRITTSQEGFTDMFVCREGVVVRACAPSYRVRFDGEAFDYSFYDGELEVIGKELTGL